ncbi:hypothetical protein [Demequina sp.]|uniref:hypothetical protein n=1 Tax=Demequina sp. TaxID=2050685 RepID=UPI003A8A2753
MGSAVLVAAPLRALVRRVLQTADAPVGLRVDDSAIAARQLYARLGFVSVA